MVVGFFAIILILGLLIFSSVLLDFIHDRLGTPIRGYFFLVHGIKWILVFAALYFLVSALYYVAPVQKSNYRFFSAGSSMCTISLVVILWALNFYFSHFSNYNLIYGSLGALFAILLWINWSSLALLVGFDLNVSIAKAKDEGVERIENPKFQDP
jgi:membrane protein